MCQTGSGAGKCAGAKSNTVRRRSNHARTEDQAGREKRANGDEQCICVNYLHLHLHMLASVTGAMQQLDMSMYAEYFWFRIRLKNHLVYEQVYEK